MKESGFITNEQSVILFANVAELEALNRTKVLAKIEARFKAVTDAGISNRFFALFKCAGVPSYMINMGDIFMSLVFPRVFALFLNTSRIN